MPHPDPKVQRILAAAMEVVARYGFRKTSMQDLADAAGISRAALYLHFRNKEDIFRACSAMIHEDMAALTQAAFDGPGSFEQRLAAGIKTYTLGFLQALDSGGHAKELFDAHAELAADISVKSVDELQGQLKRLIEQAAAKKEIKLPSGLKAAALADLVQVATAGIKYAGGPLDQAELRLEGLARMVAASVAKA